MYRKIISILIFLIFIFSLAFSNLQLYTASENYIYSLGDVDLDGRVTTSDARLALMAASGIEKLSEASFRNADYNGDGTISVYDARSILYISLDMENQIIPENGESVRAVWVSIAGGDFPSYDNLSANKLKQEIDAIVDNVYSYGLNTIYFQVRSHSDSMYNSSIFPTASALVENQGDTAPMDVLEYFIEKAHSKNIELHAWINPYRVSSRSHSTSSLAGTNPAVLHPDWIVKHFNDDGSEGGIFYDPALPEVRRLVVDGVMEIVENYDVDGIHFDDYFYPYNNAKNFEDNSSYEKYGEGKNRDDWRRENVDLLVRNVYTSIKNSKPSVKFGISPFGVWAKKTASCPEGTEGLGWPLQSYSDIYADTRNWIVNGWVDYICPQIYWQKNHSSAPFEPIADWWNDLCGEYNVDLYIGVAAYRGSETQSSYASPEEIKSQIEYINSLENCQGTVYFSYKSLLNNLAGVKNTVMNKYNKYLTGYEQIQYPDTGRGDQAYDIITDKCDLMLKLGNTDEYGPTEYCLGTLGMRESVVRTEGEYSILSNGFYIESKNLRKAEGEYNNPTALGNMYFKSSDKYTSLVIQCSQNVSNTVWLGEESAEVTLYGLYSTDINLPYVTSENRLFKSVKAQIIDNSTVKIIFDYKEKYHIFGYESKFLDGDLIIDFKNPVSVKSGAKPLEGIKISLDPGHSEGNNYGAQYTYDGVLYKEGLLTYELSCMVRDKLEKLGATVRLSHENERVKSLETLIKEFREWSPDINVSIHFNTMKGTGTETWYCYNNSKLLSVIMADKFTDATGLRNRGSKMGYYQVSRFCEFPSILFETCFLDTDNDIGWYLSNKDKAAQAIADGIVEYFTVQ